jgi:DNA-directed RNA polymerase subunit RPC12/RpoP
VINNYLPSSASVYAKKFPLSLYSQKKAEGLEQIVYCCPKCKSLFSSYSEFNCLKCKNCGSAIEISEDGDILLSNDVHSLDDLKELQFDVISHFDFMDECLISYENINYLRVINESPVKFIDNAKLEIFPNYVQIKKNNFNKTLSFDEIQDIYLELNNLIIIELKDGETVGFQGKSKENLYVLLDLFKIAK